MGFRDLTKLVEEEKMALLPSLDVHALRPSIDQMTEFYRVVLKDGWDITDPVLTPAKRVQVTLRRKIPAWRSILESAIE